MTVRTPFLRASATLLALSLTLPALAAAPAVDADKNRIRAHLNFLADDLLEGRETGSRGFDVAARYVSSQFVQYGIAPKGENGGFLQTVYLRSGTLVMESPEMEIIGKNGSEKLAFLQDFSMGPSTLEARSEVSAPLVFAGYGIRAPSFGHDDYAGLDVKGKIVVLLGGRPASFPSEEGAHFASIDHKRSMAAALGAVGIVNLTAPRAGRPFSFAGARDYLRLPRMAWTYADGRAGHEYPTLQNSATVSPDVAARLLAESGVKPDELFALAKDGKPLPHMDLNVSVRMAKRTDIKEIKSANVVGLIEGSDAQLKKEYVVFTAHLDHLGVVKEKVGDNIYNGAMDNASGVATLIETARLVSALPQRPKRSILFVALTGEEKGLLGADYFANNPTVPADAMVANVNLDMPMLTYDFANVIAFGAEHSSLKGIIENATKKMGLGVIPDPWPEQRLFTRSDHYMFVRQGVPAIFLATGLGSFNKDEAPDKLWQTFMSTHYHKPSDDLSQPLNFDAAARFAQVNFNIGMEIANEKERPQWNKGNFFGETFGKKAPQKSNP